MVVFWTVASMALHSVVCWAALMAVTKVAVKDASMAVMMAARMKTLIERYMNKLI